VNLESSVISTRSKDTALHHKFLKENV